MIDEEVFPAGAAIVVGGSGGLGAASARALARAGSDIALCYRTGKASAERLASELGELGRRVTIHVMDVTDSASIETALEQAIAGHGRVHTAVWAAGPLVEQHYLSQIPLDQLQKALEIEVQGFFRVSQAILPHFRASGGGSFVHLGSAGDLIWASRDGLSVVPKAANEAMIRGLAREEGRYNIRANSILVGVIDAGMFHELSARGHFSERWVEETQRMLALKRWGTPEEIGHAVVFLASSRAGYTTGQQIAVAGGLGV
jgi:Dehydrogenases with different specificities (related to short-chain alcohol dehydrogenases)